MDVNEVASLPLSEMRKHASKLGNTPLVPLYVVINGVRRQIHLKLEEANPTGSIKDRTGKGLMQALEERNVLNKESIIIESTSGNLGVALSFLCKVKGYHFMAVVDPKTTSENIHKMRALGAEIEMVKQKDHTGSYLLSRLERVQALCQSSRRYVWPNQYENIANPLIHYTDTGPEIYRQMHGAVDVLFIAVSTGGTLAGISRFFREVSATTRIIGVDAQGSVVFDTPPGPRLLTGIGSSKRSSFIANTSYNKYMLVKDADAFALCRALATMIDMWIGGSSGAVLAACIYYLQQHPEAQNVVCLCADHGSNYRASIYNDEWMARHGFSLTPELPSFVQSIERIKEIHTLIHDNPGAMQIY